MSNVLVKREASMRKTVVIQGIWMPSLSRALRIEKRRGRKPEQSPGPLRARIVRKEG
jgi:hypothetical protein